MSDKVAGLLRCRNWAAAAVGVAGSLLVLSGLLAIVEVAVETAGSADTAAFELYCTNSLLGSLAVNDVVITGDLDPASPGAGQTFAVDNFQAQVTVPASLAQLASEVGNTSVSGTATASIGAIGATPASLSTGALSYDQAIPSPIPSSGVQMDVPTTPATLGPFTASSSNIAVTLASSITLTISDVAIPDGLPPLVCSSYPNDLLPSGLTQNGPPPGLPVTPVIAEAGSPTLPQQNTVTGPYELYCPSTPVGSLVFNGVTSSATISPSSLQSGDQFDVTGYQVNIPVPAGVVSAAVGLSNASFDGVAASNVDAYGATPTQMPTGTLGFDVPIPNPVPAGGVNVAMPGTAETLGPFTATGGPVTMAQDPTILVVAALSSVAFHMTCTAYPNDTIATSGSTGEVPQATPIEPVIATGSASGSPVTTTTVPGSGPGSQVPPGSPYELYCSGTPIGDIAVNDVTNTATLSPSTLDEGDTFTLADLQAQFTIPQAVAQQAENLGLTTLSGDVGLFLNATGAFDEGFPYYPGDVDLSFAVTLPSPVPAGGVQFTATPSQGSPQPTFQASGGPILLTVDGVNLDVYAFDDQFGLFCDTLANDSVPTGIAINEPSQDYVTPVLAQGTASSVPPPPGSAGPYELYCPNTPVGDIVLNDVTTSGQLDPPDPSVGSTFDLTGYQSQVTIPAEIVEAAAALGSTDISGYATAQLDATGATPATMAAPPLDYDVAIPSQVPAAGLTLAVPSSPATVGPFTSTSSDITVAEDANISLTLIIAGSPLDLSCLAYPDDSLPTGITVGPPPSAQPMSPTIATSSSGPPSTTPTTQPGSSSTIPVTTLVASSPTTGSSSGSGPDDPGAATSGAVSASSGSLAFTGTGPGLRRTAAVGATMLLLGLLMLLLVGVPGRRRRLADLRPTGHQVSKYAAEGLRWVLGR